MLSDLQRKKLTRYFRVYDIDDNGQIGPGDFERVVENVRILHGLSDHSPAHEQLRQGYMRRWEALRESADADENGGVDLAEWLDYWEEVLQEDARYEEEIESTTARLFEIFDTDEDGVLGPQEFMDFHGIFGLSASQAREVFQELDADDNGLMSHEELLAATRQFYRSDDPEAPGNLLYGPIDGG